jgi:hypothetical protein
MHMAGPVVFCMSTLMVYDRAAAQNKVPKYDQTPEVSSKIGKVDAVVKPGSPLAKK